MKQTLLLPDQHSEALHPQDSPGLITIAIRDRERRRWEQITRRPDDAAYILRQLRGRADVYVTQNRFRGPRSVAQLLQLSALWADLDYYKLPELRGADPQRIRQHALWLLRDVGIPAPGLSIFTGRGLCLVWRHGAVPRGALPRWTACQRRICEVLRPLGADSGALDAARVLRVIGTQHGEVHRLVEAISPLDPAWDFDDLADEVLPLARHELAEIRSLRVARAKRPGAGPPAPARNILTWWETVLSDLQRLRSHRWFGQLPPGQRDQWVFWAGVAVSWLAEPRTIRRELYLLAHESAGWDSQETDQRLSAVVRRYYRSLKGETVTWNGQARDPRYWARPATIVDRLEISAEEMRAAGLRALVSADVRRELHAAAERERTRAAGVAPRAEYLAEASSRRQEARELRAQGLSIRVIARALRTSPSQVQRLLR